MKFNHMKFNYLSIICILSLALSMSAAEAGRHKKQRGPVKMLVHSIMHHIDISSEQKAEIRALMQQARIENSPANPIDHQKKHLQYFELLEAETFDEAKAISLITETQSRRLTKKLEKLKLKHAILQVLTLEQRQELKEQMTSEIRQKNYMKQQ